LSDTFYSSPPGEGPIYQTNTITVGAATAGGSALELRVTDDAVTAEQAYQFLEKLADYFATRNQAVIPAGTLIG
jgi:hypothetical protein